MGDHVAAEAVKKPNLIRRLYDWVLHWAETPYGMPALFVLAFAESSFFPIPPDVLLIALAISAPTRAFRFALICSVGSITGGLLGYVIGWKLMDLVGDRIINFYGYQEQWDALKGYYDDGAFLYIFLAAFTFIPFKVFTIASGAFGTFWPMVGASVVGRSLRFVLVAWLVKKYGAPIKGWIDKYFNRACLIFVLLLVGGFVLIKYAF